MSQAAGTLPPPPGTAVGSGTGVGSRTAPRWGVQTGLFRPRRLAFWLFVVALILGTLYGLLLQLVSILISPAGWLLSWLLMLLFIVPVAAVIRWLDLYEREPRSLVVGAFLWGALVATMFSGIGNDLWGVVITRLAGAEFAAQWSAALTAPVIEEIYKYLGIVLLYLIARLEFDDLIDGFVYGALVGLGFAVAEDIFYFMFHFGGDVVGVLQGFYVRVIATGLYGHVTFTGLAGIGFAYFVRHRLDRPLLNRVLVAAGLLLVAIGAHFFWNSPLLDDLDLWVYGFVKGLPFLIGLGILVYLARRREHVALADILATEVGSAGITAQELELLRDRRVRRAAEQSLIAKAGPQAAMLLQMLQREQVRLALVASAVDSRDDALLLGARAACRNLRLRLWHLPGATEALGVPVATHKAEWEAAQFVPDRAVAPAGAWAWATPSQGDRRRTNLAAGLPVQVLETRGDWLLVRAREGWHGWTGAPYLAPLPAPPAALPGRTSDPAVHQ